MFSYEERDSIAIITLNHGKVNAIDTDLIRALSHKFDELESSPVKAVVLTGTGSVFSAGVDLIRVLNGGKAYLDVYLPALMSGLERIFTFSKPVIVAVNGHAIAGGCVLACACDYRFMTDGRGKIGVAELQVGVPFPAIAIEIMRSIVPRHRIQEVVYGARTYTAADALERGLIDEVVNHDELLDAAIAMARRLGDVPRTTFALTKSYLRRPAMERVRASQEYDRTVSAAWEDPEMLAIITAYLQKTVGK